MDSAFRPALAAQASRQCGLITRRQALSAGYADDEVRALTSRRGPWVVVRRGVYADRAAYDAAAAPQQAWLRDLAAHLAMVTPHLLSHDSAARALGVPMLRAPNEWSHITRPGVGGSRTAFGVKHHLGREIPAEVVATRGVLSTGWARTSLDVAREHGFSAGVVAIDAAFCRGTHEREYERELVLMRRWPHVRRCRQALAFADPGAESPGESLARILISELDLGPVFTQFAVDLGRKVVWCDLRVGCHVFEFDGRVKYRHAELGGVATRDIDDLIWEEKRRQIDVCGVGLGASRIVWDDFWGAARIRAKARLTSEYRVTERRFGRDLPAPLARFAADHPRFVRRAPTGAG